MSVGSTLPQAMTNDKLAGLNGGFGQAALKKAGEHHWDASVGKGQG
jgi:hypothetical protein